MKIRDAFFQQVEGPAGAISTAFLGGLTAAMIHGGLPRWAIAAGVGATLLLGGLTAAFVKSVKDDGDRMEKMVKAAEARAAAEQRSAKPPAGPG